MRIFFFCMFLWWLPGFVWAAQYVSLEPGTVLTTARIDAAFVRALRQEIRDLVPKGSPKRQHALTTLLSAEQDQLILGYSRVAVPESENASLNSSALPVVLEVYTNTQRIRRRLGELGAFAAAGGEKYVLKIDTPLTGKTLKRVAALETLCGLQPVAQTDGLPELQVEHTLQQNWRASIGLADGWSTQARGADFDAVWLAVWKDYFLRKQALAPAKDVLHIRVSGWVSSDGPMMFDAQLQSWAEEVLEKNLEDVEMEDNGTVGVWSVHVRDKQAFARRIRQAVRAQGLQVHILE